MKRSYKIFSMVLVFILLLGVLSLFADEAADTAKPTEEREQSQNAIKSLKHIRSGVLYDADTMTQMYSYASPVRTYPGVTAKMMVSFVVLDIAGDRLSEEVTVVGNIASIQTGSHIELKGGEVITIRELLAAVILNNANDAAYALAMHLSGSIEDFVAIMNEKAADLGMKNTNYVSVTDADETGAYTNAEDVALLSKALYSNKVYMEFASKGTYEIPATNKKKERKLYTKNYLLSKLIYPDYYMAEATGLCAGYTQMGGYCIVATADIGDRDYICIVMDADGSASEGFYNFIAAKEILQKKSGTYSFKKLMDETRIMGEIKVKLAEEYDWVSVVPKGEIIAFVPDKYSVEDAVTYDAKIYYDVLTAPVISGETVGEVKVYYFGEYKGTLTLVTRRGLGQSTSERYMTRLIDTLTSRPVVIGAVCISGVLVFGVLLRAHMLYRKRVKIQIEYEEQ